MALAVGVLGTADAASASPYLYSANSDGSVSQFDATSGGLTSLSPASVAGATASPLTNIPIRLAISPDATSLYLPGTGDGTVHAYDIGADGRLAAEAGAAAGTQPVAAAVSPDGKHVYVANYGSGSVSQYDVGTGGALTPMATASVPAGTQPTAVSVSPDGRNVYVSNSGAATISQYAVGSDGALTPLTPATVSTGTTPFDLLVALDASSVYVSSLDGLYQYDIGSDGTLSPKSPPSLTGSSWIGLAATADGQWLYGLDLGSGDIGAFTIGADGGLDAGAEYTAHGPVDIAVSPDGHSVYAAQSGVEQFDRSPSGAVTPKTPASVSVGTTHPYGLALTPSSDIALAMSADRTQATVGQIVTYTLTVSNSGSPATDVMVSDPLSPDLALVEASASQGSCTAAGTVACNLGNVPAGVTPTVTVTARVVRAGTVSNSGSVSAQQPDPSAANNSATLDVTANAAPIAATSAASDVTETSATLNGVVVPNGRPTSYQFALSNGSSIPAAPVAVGDGSDAVAVAEPMTGLAPSTTYSYRLVATNADGTTVAGASRTFTTAAAPAETQTTQPPPSGSTAPIVNTGPAAKNTIALSGKPASRHAKVYAKLLCRGAAGSHCQGTIALTVRIRRHGRMRTVTAGSAAYSIAAGASRSLSVRLNRSGRAALAKAHSLRGTLTLRLGRSVVRRVRITMR